MCFSMAEIKVVYPSISFSFGSDEQLTRKTKAEAPVIAEVGTKLRHSIAWATEVK